MLGKEVRLGRLIPNADGHYFGLTVDHAIARGVMPGLDTIDATLYYLSEPTEGDRELHARGKTEQDILAELSSGIPEESDND